MTLRIFFSRLAELKVMRPARVQSSFSTCVACVRVRARACVNRWRCIHAWQWMVLENGRVDRQFALAIAHRLPGLPAPVPAGLLVDPKETLVRKRLLSSGSVSL